MPLASRVGAATSSMRFSCAACGYQGMEFGKEKIDDAIFALLFLTLDRDGRAWKGFDWDSMNRLPAKGHIDNPVGNAKSVILTDEGIARSEHLFREMFGKSEYRAIGSARGKQGFLSSAPSR